MAMFEKMFSKKKSAKSAELNDKPKKAKKTAKEQATEAGEPYVAILSMDVNPDNVAEGAFELDWNDKFIANLVRAGYQKDPKDTDADIVDRWFHQVCRNVVLETYEQEQAMNPGSDVRYVREKNIGNGRKEIS